MIDIFARNSEVMSRSGEEFARIDSRMAATKALTDVLMAARTSLPLAIICFAV
jgi:hypothetical protein